MEEIKKSVDGLRTEFEELRAELDKKATKDQLEEIRAELDTKATKAQLKEVRADTKATKVQVEGLTDMMDLMQQSFDQMHHRMDRMEERQISQDLKMEDFRSEVRFFGEGIRSNIGRIENVEGRVDHLESKSA